MSFGELLGVGTAGGAELGLPSYWTAGITGNSPNSDRFEEATPTDAVEPVSFLVVGNELFLLDEVHAPEGVPLPATSGLFRLTEPASETELT